jgi:hypothetical protein
VAAVSGLALVGMVVSLATDVVVVRVGLPFVFALAPALAKVGAAMVW